MTETHYDEQDRSLVIPEVYDEDVEQEAALIELETGRRANKKLIRRRMEASQMQSFGVMPLGVQGDALAQPEINHNAIDRLIDYAETLDDHKAALIHEFLENPEEANLQLLLHNLGFSKKKARKSLQAPGTSVPNLVLRSLSTQYWIPISRVYELVQASHIAKRPNAAARQALRRLTSEGKTEMKETGSGKEFKLCNPEL